MKVCLALIACLTLGGPTQLFAQSETVATAAKKAFDKGEFELAKGNHSGALTLLKTAVRIAPENALYHHRLGKAFLAAENYDEMWIHYRKAVLLDHTNEEFANDFLRIWKFHDMQGTVNCGVVSQELLAKLGEPDKRIENESMKRWVYGIVAVDFGQDRVARVIDLRGYTSEAADEPEHVKVQTDPQQWKVAHHMISRRDDNLELTRPDETVQNWTELFSKQRFPLMSRTQATVKGMADTMHESLKKTDGLVQFEILSESPTSIAYHWRTRTTEQNPAQHEIAKVIKGQKDFYRVAYVKKTGELTETEFAKWKKVIGEATLVPRTMNPNVDTAASAVVEGVNAPLSSWELGKDLGFAALVRGRHGPDELVKRTLVRVSRHAHALGVDVPAPGPLTDDSIADTAAAIAFLLDTAGKPIYNSLQAEHGDESSALFELGTKSTLLLLLYQPGDSTSEAFASAIERSAGKASLDSSVWQPLVEKVGQGESSENVRSAIQEFQQQMTKALGAK